MGAVHFTAKVQQDRSLVLPPEAWELLMPGDEIGVDIDASTTVAAKPNERALAVLSRVAQLKRGMRQTDGTQTVDFIREGRDGEMYGL
jgi:hypothetical protein